jgi:hypothetical protein
VKNSTYYEKYSVEASKGGAEGYKNSAKVKDNWLFIFTQCG